MKTEYLTTKMEFKMKTMKYILLIICVACASTMMAMDYKLHQTSSATFKSTSNFRYSSAGMNGGNLYVSAPAQGGGAMASVPPVSFRSTSTMSLSGRTLPCAAMELTVGDEMPNAENNTPRGPQRVSPNQPPEDPMENPLGDAVLPLLLLAAGYAIYTRRKNKQATDLRTSDTKQQ